MKDYEIGINVTCVRLEMRSKF